MYLLNRIALVQNPVPNAYTLAIGGRKPFVVVHTALLELLEPLEVQVSILLPPCLCLSVTWYCIVPASSLLTCTAACAKPDALGMQWHTSLM